ncbi:Holliday junction branch migration protein RuvA [Microbacter margulisiae]|uniref:Holliday junction branch migration complex subunit RuvA n=1 Tax=Microbacter margulisiae TaxID=1350067 RepID=A0A7W5DPI3_9PORP|nr:Holliday junction branch migration protein RuvA [Microbacter margulisiae]MBB3186586.1 Holliday junction DNA helicase RuvA [Microbacter margulisiae]
MIEYIKGNIVDLTPIFVTIETGGIGYLLHITLPTYVALESKKEAQVYVYEAIREDAYQLFGFLHKTERELFTRLVSVSGVGANTARMILSSLSVDELISVILSENTLALKNIKGIGIKTAQRIIIELKDKVGKITEGGSITSIPNSSIKDEALTALLMLGFNQIQAQKTLTKIFTETPRCSVEEAIRLALKML